MGNVVYRISERNMPSLMPNYDTNLLVTQVQPQVEIRLEPVRNLLYSLLLLYRAEHMPGVTDWVTRTVAAMPPELRYTNGVVINGLCYAVEPARSFPDFPAYIAGLAQTPPLALRDRLLRGSCQYGPIKDVDPDPAVVLASTGSYITFLERTFGQAELDIPVETAAYELLCNPERLRDVVVAHMQAMWRGYLEREWAEVQPMLRESLSALQQVNLAGLTTLDAAQKVTGQDLIGSKWEPIVSEAHRIIFVPSAHIGPYLGKQSDSQTLWLFFGARLPSEVYRVASPASRSELLVRLAALSDDTRLQILALIVQQGELCAPDIMAQLGLSQSATSRHLQQLSATGLLTERRRDSAKCYQLNRERLRDTLRALDRYFSPA